VAGELLPRADVTLLHFVENLPPYQFARDTYAAFRDQVAKIADLAEHLWQYPMAVAQSLEKQEETAKKT
jgi:hypothetical protein